MVKTFKKGLPIKEYRIDSELEGHIFALGRIGGGKSVSTLSILQGYHDDKNYKIWDIYGGDRHEGVYWTIPSQDNEYWDKFKAFGTPDEEGPKQYYVNLLYPHFESKLPKKLPQKLPYVKSTVFTIPLKDVDVEDIRVFAGNIADTGKYVWDEITTLIKKKDTCAVLNTLSKKVKGTNTTIQKRFITPMVREKFLMNANCNYNIDLISEAKNKEVISVLCLEFVPEKYHLFIINYLIKKMTDLIEVNGIPKKNILFIREAATFFRATDESVLEDKYKIFRTKLSHYLRMGRRGTYFALDCQSAAEVKSLVQGSEDYLLMFKTTAWRDKEEMCVELKRERRMRPDQIADLAFLEKGEAFIAETGKVVHKVKITLPRTMYWKKEYPNFYKRLWENYGGKWMNTGDVKDYINELCNNNKDDYEEKSKNIKINTTKINEHVESMTEEFVPIPF